MEMWRIFPCFFASSAASYRPSSPPGFGQKAGLWNWIVELVNVDVVGLECAQAGLKVAPEALGGLRAGLGRQHDPVAHPGKGRADLLLAVGIRAGGVEEIDAAVAGLVQQLHRLRLADALNG